MNYVEGFEAGNNNTAHRHHNPRESRRPQITNVNYIEGLEARNNNIIDSSSLQTVPIFILDQYNHLVNLINKEVSSYEIIANMEGIHHRYSSTLNVCCTAGNDTILWVVDTRATDHMVSSLGTLLKRTPVTPKTNTVYLPNGQTTIVTHTDSITLFDANELHNVLYIPNFTYNLLSISKLTKELNYYLSFHPSFYLF